MKSRSAIGALAAAVLAVGVLALLGAGLVPGPLQGDDRAATARAAAPRAAAVQPIGAGTVLKAADACARPTRDAFVPTSIRIEGVTRNTRVLALPRDSQNVPGVPAVSDKSSFAWDAPGILPGSARGNVLLNAHTWPDGTAMGNRLLDRLHKDTLIELRRGHRHLCYKVTERLEVRVENPPLRRVYDFAGKPQVVIIVCSGVRRGPGDWSHRTIWFAEPVDVA